MIHRTFRSLDEAPRLVAFTVKQWAMLIAGSAAVLGVIHLAHLPTKPAITLCVFAIGLPAALTYVSESGGLQLGVLLREMFRWRASRHALPCASRERSRAHGLLVLAAAEQPTRQVDANRDDAALDELLSGERWG
ncbi:MAG TPA: hypothetical protein VK538_04260 [Solirubrobacteraceae bacterium]|nr:hypothetical protein [Solirubrobacteraceae bacterium]